MITKTKHKYKEIKENIDKMDEDQFSDWLKTNEIEYENPLLEIVREFEKEQNERIGEEYE